MVVDFMLAYLQYFNVKIIVEVYFLCTNKRSIAFLTIHIQSQY